MGGEEVKARTKEIADDPNMGILFLGDLAVTTEAHLLFKLAVSDGQPIKQKLPSRMEESSLFQT